MGAGAIANGRGGDLDIELSLGELVRGELLGQNVGGESELNHLAIAVLAAW